MGAPLYGSSGLHCLASVLGRLNTVRSHVRRQNERAEAMYGLC